MRGPTLAEDCGARRFWRARNSPVRAKEKIVARSGWRAVWPVYGVEPKRRERVEPPLQLPFPFILG
ncbi:hypothetical protein CCR94_12655 [Rhodoblastus sphagnicola]|uniref:Uncharacterized protein n=1 Tax=Rhodoblastus sphagnicola TaxID=333368 RepID=A0A2S6N6Z7_9HYPH|nr:hypothetical protein CCR94_12655 [Rhodoblastus sphagnicola]